MDDDNKLTLEDELLLHAYLDGEMPPEQQRLFAARLDQEPALTAVLAQWHDLMVELNTLPEPQLTHDLTAGVLNRLELQTMLPIPAWKPLLATQIILALLTGLLAWPLLASWVAMPLVLSDWAASLRLVWSGIAQAWTMWWTANVWTTDVWLARWTAVWQGLDQTISISFSLLLPLAVLAAVMWLLSLRLIWRSTPLTRYLKG